MFEKVRALIFDMDGVLMDSEPVIKAAAIAGLKEFGVNAKIEDFEPFVGMGEDRFIGGVAEKHGVPYRPEMKKRVYEIYVDIVADELGIYEGIQEFLSEMKERGYVLALASSADKIKVEANLKVTGIPVSLFSTIICGEDVEKKKPFPDIYLYAARQIGVPPENCLVVEDAISGIKAAKAAGMQCIAVSSSFDRETLEKEGADLVVDNTVEIASILKKSVD
ncbi:MAG TPA: HAD-IA family hydrolase [Clostridiales bacterium]|nr:HAD-IA family hydrolase [Clostridiales bacterium]